MQTQSNRQNIFIDGQNIFTQLCTDQHYTPLITLNLMMEITCYKNKIRITNHLNKEKNKEK